MTEPLARPSSPSASPPRAAATRRRLLQAATALCLDQGPRHLSLEAVAARAGVSKGGLLYHFPSKHALLRALVAAHIDEIRAEIAAEAPGCLVPEGGDCGAASRPDSDLALAGARAYLRLMAGRMRIAGASAAGMLAAIAEDPAIFAPLLEFRAEVQAMFRRCPEPGQAELIFLASQGIVHICMTDPAAPGDHAAAALAGLEAALPAGDSPA